MVGADPAQGYLLVDTATLGGADPQAGKFVD
jgi:hypothetical protein